MEKNSIQQILDVFKSIFNLKEFDFDDKESSIALQLLPLENPVQVLTQNFKFSSKEIQILKIFVQENIFKLVMNQFCQLFFFFDLINQEQKITDYLIHLKSELLNNFQILSKFVLYQQFGTKRLPFLISFLLFHELSQKQFFSSKQNICADIIFFCDFGAFFLLNIKILKKTIEIQINHYSKMNRKLENLRDHRSKSLIESQVVNCNRFIDHPIFDQIDENRNHFRKIIQKYSQKLVQMKMHNNKIFEQKKQYFEFLKNKEIENNKTLSRKSKSEVVLHRLEKLQPQKLSKVQLNFADGLKREKKIMNGLVDKLDKKIYNKNLEQKYQYMMDFAKNLLFVNKQFEQNMQRNFTFVDEPLEYKKSLNMSNINSQIEFYKKIYTQKENKIPIKSNSLKLMKINYLPKAVKLEQNNEQKKPFKKVQNLFDLFSQQKQSKKDEVFRKKKKIIEKIVDNLHFIN